MSPAHFHSIDLQVLHELFGDDNEVIREILETYASDLEQQRTNLMDAASARDRARFGRILHSLKGASANVGAHAFAAVCASAEPKVPSAPWSELDALCRDLRAEMEVLGTTVRERLNTL
jgi:HPt (histidine-containing phosphotransfer) domain-containing protein